jgi:hypothetical protein
MKLEKTAEGNSSVEFEVELLDWNDVHNMRCCSVCVCVCTYIHTCIHEQLDWNDVHNMRLCSVCVCLCVYIHTYIHTCMHAYMSCWIGMMSII